MRSFSRGFTLIELLVVIAIIGILSSVVLASLNSAREKGRDSRRISDIKQLQLALELYYDGNSSTYPANLADVAPDYISVIPTGPQGDAYQYASVDSGSSYVLAATLEDENHSVFDNSVTGTDVGGSGIDCGTPVYCVRP
ncbi:hypothetical protein COU20_01565 [Candidatus Kaiserbacteria bacterium CG10_big_fil_rev_8_21_14_0_10_59_10]|uniref:Type II secretion system protein GspG C-terminal domain-containing protein n=1 Tax=Candidatus Kaiserbacteria bacterium CG10_big_fil_rev_8_21_14_0_10_59_10 TaxID=1974612 RepID=A0A2H0U888_9BACT|nr:MAG: hypothetical protein COU20_01565 [Candidatus Kaiserbacteria bacterium CG10_big_fil_rev_8_21_14_0_10_59_10]